MFFIVNQYLNQIITKRLQNKSMQGSFERINDSPADRNNRTIQTNVTVKYGPTKKE